MSWLALGPLARELRDGKIVVGSGADADWRLPTADLMPRHFTLTVHGLNVAIRPTTTKAVVVVNDTQLDGSYHLLNDGDVICAGAGRFIFSDDEARIDDATYDTGAGAPTNHAFLIDELRRTAYRLVHRSTTIGRDPSNSIVVADSRVSRFHAEVRREAGGFVIHAMGAGTTRVDREIIRRPRLLSEGDALEVASNSFRFTCDALPPDVRTGIASVGISVEVAGQPSRARSGPAAGILAPLDALRSLPARVVIGIVLVAMVGLFVWLAVAT